MFMTDLSNKKILIIGGSSGFGLKTAELALKANAEVIIIGRDEHRVDQSVTSLKSNANQVAGEVLDATNSEQLNRLLTHYGQFDHVISMLGGVVGLLPLQSLKSDKQLRTNFSLI
jgi:NADP-dependent 3-hydroxy acid dehydrogenase YdfG